jgi:hypothetical protein
MNVSPKCVVNDTVKGLLSDTNVLEAVKPKESEIIERSIP